MFGLSIIPFTVKILHRDPALLPIIFPALVVRAAALGAGLVIGLVHFMARPVTPRPIFSLYNRIAKRLMDIVGALFGLIFSAPLLAVLAVLIKLDSPGPIFFKQIRVGENGHPFRIIKLRSMVQNAEDLLPEIIDLEKLESPAFKIKDDPRITRIGYFLRRTSLDEIPQFWNVLVGNMSLVGPRPEEVALVQKYNDWHRKRLAVKPGMTGPMQVNGRGDLSLDERVHLELEYIEHYSIWRDLAFLIKTLPAVLLRRGAH
jgi:lipopolysaccharide/colanic/teichoic acid biosynthesis glycosyltransferase